jgi:CBS domain-containing membrane protein
MFSHWLLGEVNLWFIAPMGASAVLLFGVPSSPLAQPWSIVGGNVLSALIGVTVGWRCPNLRWPAAGGRAGDRRNVFPALPASAGRGGGVDGDPRRRGVQSEGYHFVLTPVLLNSLMLALLAIVFNNLVGRRYPHPLAAEEVKAEMPLGIAVTREDIHAALLTVSSSILMKTMCRNCWKISSRKPGCGSPARNDPDFPFQPSGERDFSTLPLVYCFPPRH